MRVFRNDNGFDTVCRREAKTRAAADTHTYTKGTIIVIIPKKRAVARQLVFYITILFIPILYRIISPRPWQKKKTGIRRTPVISCRLMHIDRQYFCRNYTVTLLWCRYYRRRFFFEIQRRALSAKRLFKKQAEAETETKSESIKVRFSWISWTRGDAYPPLLQLLPPPSRG